MNFQLRYQWYITVLRKTRASPSLYFVSNAQRAATRPRATRLSRAALRALLRAGRITKYSPSWRGVNRLLNLYRKIIPEDFFVRIDDFDGDIVFDVDPSGNMGLCLWHYPHLFEKEERELFCASITPGCTVLDVGANIGFYTLLAAKRGARVFAIEADPINAAQLRRHIEINGFNDRVTVFEMAATDCIKEVQLYRHPFNLGESNVIEKGKPSGTVQGRTIDSLDLPPINICKMDVEGAEPMALSGMERTLARSPGIKLMVEYARHFGNSEALLAYLRSNFSSVTVIERQPPGAPDEIPAFCNLLAIR